MGLPTNINTLLSGNVEEWARIEFKESWKPEASLKTICAFANDIDNWGGGYLILGVEEENGRPKFPIKGIPIDKVDDILKDLLNKCKMIQPEYLPVVEVVDFQERKLIVIWAPGGDLRPYKSPKSFTYSNGKVTASTEKIPYIRRMASTIMPSLSEENLLYSLANKIPFDDRVNQQSELEDLNVTLIKSYLTKVKSSLINSIENEEFYSICQNMGIVNTLPEYRKPKNIGLLFFNMEPDKFFPCTQIDIVQFPDGLGGDNIIENTFKGPIHQQLREALQFIKNSIVTKKIVKSADKAEADWVYNYPYAALEEALANAVYHRGYDIREPIEVRVEKDMIEIVSFPGPDRSVTQEGLKRYKVSNRRYRNRRIGDILKELHLTEGRNTGFGKILRALEVNGSPKPEFETDEDHSYFISRLFVHEAFLKDEDSERNQKGAEKEPKRSRKKEPKKGAERKLDILQKLEENPEITQVKLMEAFDLSRKQIQKIIKDLREEGLVERQGSNRNGRWVVKK